MSVAAGSREAHLEVDGRGWRVGARLDAAAGLQPLLVPGERQP